MLLTHLPANDSALAVALYGDEASWSRTDHLLAMVVDAVQMLGWNMQRMLTGKSGPQPKPIQRPGLPEPEGTVRHGTPRPLSEVKAILAASRPGAGQEVTDNGS